MNLFYLFPLFFCVVFAIPVTYDQRQDGDVNVRADLQNFVIVALVPKIGGISPGSSLLDALSNSLLNKKELKTIGSGKLSHEAELEPDISEDGEVPQTRIAEAFVKQKPYQVDISKTKSNSARRSSERRPEVPESRNAEAKRGVQKQSPAAEGSPVPSVLPVKNNQYVIIQDRNGRILEEVADFNSDLPKSESSEIEDNDTDEAPEESFQIASGKDSGLLLLGATEQCGPDQYRDAQGICQLLTS